MPVADIKEPSLVSPETRGRSSLSAWVALAVIAVVIWGRLIQHESVEWTVNEQYAYGWAVPLLCAFLMWRRWVTLGAGETTRGPAFQPVSVSAFQTAPRFLLSALLVVAAFVFTRWIGEANPDWRLVSWALALEVIAGSMIFLYVTGGVSWVKHFAFPILFFLMAVPWPTLVEQPVIQILTRVIVAATVELLNAFGMAALPRGNIIETAGGLVDVDEACSGIRSLQAALMLSLFFGELRRFTISKRVTLCAISFALACVFNLARTVALSLIAAKQGSAAVQRWHDLAGIAILVGCFTGVWAAAAWLGRTPSPPRTRRESGEVSNASRQSNLILNPALVAASRRPLLILALLLLGGEVAIYLWYASASRAPAIDWTAELPRANPTFRTIELPRATLRILRFNESQSGAWLNGDGTMWQMIYLRWRPGRVAVHLARNHTPEICLPAAGKNLRHVSEMKSVSVAGISLPFRCYTTEQDGRPVFIFYSLWEDGAREQHTASEFLTWKSRWDAVVQRRRNPGQRAIHVAVRGARDLAEAEASLRHELPGLISIQPR